MIELIANWPYQHLNRFQYSYISSVNKIFSPTKMFIKGNRIFWSWAHSSNSWTAIVIIVILVLESDIGEATKEVRSKKVAYISHTMVRRKIDEWYYRLHGKCDVSLNTNFEILFIVWCWGYFCLFLSSISARYIIQSSLGMPLCIYFCTKVQLIRMEWISF